MFEALGISIEVLAVVIAFVVMRNGQKRDADRGLTESAAMRTELTLARDQISEISRLLQESQTVIYRMSDRVTAVEGKVDALHRRVDALENR